MYEFLDSLPRLIWTATPNGDISFINKAWLNYTGETSWENAIHPDEKNDVLKAWGDAVSHERTFRYRYRLKNHKNEYKWFICVSTPVKNEKNELSYWFSTDAEITSFIELEIEKNDELNFFNELFQVEADAVFLIENAGGRIIKANDSASSIYLYTKEELLQMKNTDLSHEPEKTQKATQAPIQKTSQTVLIPLRYHKKKDGTVFPVEITGHFFTYKQMPVHIAIIKDITERKKVEDSLKASEEKYRAAFFTSPDSININRLDGLYVDVNEGFCNLTGYKREEVIGKLSSEIKIWAIPEDREKMIKALKTVGYINDLESVFRIKDGTTKTCLFSVKLFQLGEENHILSITKDISEIKKTQENLKRSEEKYRFLAENITDVLWVLNLNTMKWDYISPSIYKLRGVTLEEAMNEKIQDILTEESYQHAMKVIPERIKKFNEKPNDFHTYQSLLQNKRKDGSVIWVEVSSQYLKNDQGEIIIQGTSRDVSARKKAEDELKDSENLFKSITQNSTELIILSDNDDKITFVSDKCLKILDCESDKVINKKFPYKVHEDHENIFKEHWLKLKDNGTEFINLEYKIITHKNEERWISHSGRKIIFENKKIYFLSTIQNITEKINLEKERAETQTQLFHSSKLASIGTMAAGIAHEINNPLYFALGYLESIQEEIKKSNINNSEIDISLLKQESALLRIKEIVRGLRLFTRIDQSKTITLDLHRLLRETIMLVEEMYSKEKIKISKKFFPKTIYVNGNFGRLSQVFLNLISNSHDALINLEKTDKIISISTEQKENTVYIEITDNGIGIPKSKLNQIFDPFFTTKAPGHGTGIGLSIAKSIVVEYFGEISVKSDENKGTTIYIKLPVAKKTQEIEPSERPITVQLVLSGKALVVDDEEEGLILISRHLKQMGITVDTARSGQEAIDILKTNSYNYLITDLKMPGMDGIELIKKIHENKLDQDMKLIILTGAEVEAYSDAGNKYIRSLNVNSVIKPATKEDLFNALTKND